MQNFRNLRGRLMQSKAAKVAVGVVAVVVASASNAAVDVSSTVAALADTKTAVLAIGVAVISIVVGIKLYKWITRAL